MLDLKINYFWKSADKECEGLGEVTFEADRLRDIVPEMASDKYPGLTDSLFSSTKYFLMLLVGT